MSSTSQVTTFEDLYTDLGNRLRVSLTNAATLEQLKRYINIAHQDIYLGFDYKFPWCERQSVLRTKAPYTTGTVSISTGSVTLTGSGTLWNTSNGYAETNVEANGKFLFEGSQDVYKTDSVLSNTSVTLFTKYVGSASLNGATYTYFEDECDLASTFLRPVDFQWFSPSMNIPLISRHMFRKLYPVVTTSGRPRVACIIDTTTTGTDLRVSRKVVFYPYPDAVYNIPYTFITQNIATTAAGVGLTSMSAVDDTPILPLRYRHVIVLHALYNWYRDKKDDARMEAAKAEYTDLMTRIISDHDIATHTTANLRPQMGSYIDSAKNPWSRRSGRRIYDLNDEFDSFLR